MKLTTISAGLVIVTGLATASRPLEQQRPDFSGGWAATKDAPEGIAAAPSAVFTPRFWMDQKGDTLIVTRRSGDAGLSITLKLDGNETRSRVPGPMCLGDSGVVTSAAWEGNSLVYRILGTIPPGGEKVTPANVRQVFRKLDADRVQVESVMRLPGQTEFSPVATIYARMSDPPPAPQTLPPVKAAPAALARLAWLGGNWAGTQGTSAIEERWTPAAGGTMLAVSRTVSASGAVSAFEYLCVAERAGSLVYTAMPNGRTPATDFMLTAIDETSATFENPSHDFPKMIRYVLKPEGVLEASISAGPGQRTTTFTYKKQ